MSYGHGNSGVKRLVVKALSGFRAMHGYYSRKVRLECGHEVAQASGRRIASPKDPLKHCYCHLCKKEKDK